MSPCSLIEEAEEGRGEKECACVGESKRKIKAEGPNEIEDDYICGAVPTPDRLKICDRRMGQTILQDLCKAQFLGRRERRCTCMYKFHGTDLQLVLW